MTNFARISAVVLTLSLFYAISSGNCSASEKVESFSGTLLSQCALTESHDAYCWGYNHEGQAGIGRRDFDQPLLYPMRVSFPKGKVRQLSIGGNSGCLIDTDQRLYCWGSNRDGLLGFSKSQRFILKPKFFPAIPVARKVVVDGGLVCAIDMRSDLYCWGDNSAGELANGTTRNSTVPVRISLPSEVRDVEASYGTVCAITEKGRLFCWGNNSHMKLGLGFHDKSVPMPFEVMGFDSPVVKVSLDQDTSCAVTRKGSVYCWGFNLKGSLGSGRYDDYEADEPAPVLRLQETATGVASGWSSCAVLRSGGLSCWGFNEMGAIGDGSRESKAYPTEVRGLGPVKEAFSNGLLSCAVTNAGELFCWGSNTSGALALPDSHMSATRPLEVKIP